VASGERLIGALQAAREWQKPARQWPASEGGKKTFDRCAPGPRILGNVVL
jgi:hypothetical protein